MHEGGISVNLWNMNLLQTPYASLRHLAAILAMLRKRPDLYLNEWEHGQTHTLTWQQNRKKHIYMWSPQIEIKKTSILPQNNV